MPVNRLLGTLALLLALIQMGCRCAPERAGGPGQPGRARQQAPGAAALAVAASETQAPAAVVWHPVGLGDAESLLGRVQTWLAPRLGPHLTVGRHALERSRGGRPAAVDIVEFSADGVTLAWPPFDLRVERGRERATARIGSLSMPASDDVSDRLWVLSALASLAHPQTWGGAAGMRVESLGGRSDGVLSLRLALPALGVRFVAELRADGELIALTRSGRGAHLIEGGKALRMDARRGSETWRWQAQAPADAPAERDMLRVPVQGSPMVQLLWSVLVLERPGALGGYSELEFDKAASSITWRALRVPVSAPRGTATGAGGAVLPVQLGQPQLTGELHLTIGGLGDAERAVAALALPDGCYVLRLAGLLGHTDGGLVLPYAVHACAL